MTKLKYLTCTVFALLAVTLMLDFTACTTPEPKEDLDAKLKSALQQHGFTGQVDQSVERRLARQLNPKLVELGQLIFFDRFLGLHEDNACAGCHSPTAGFGDTQSIAIGVDNNGVVGPNRAGPRNQRRTPGVINNAFYPALMWNGRFSAPSGDPFDNSKGFSFPPPEGNTKFPPNDGEIKHLLAAQGHIPFTELPEMAGFNGIRDQEFFNSPRFNNKLFMVSEEAANNLGQSDRQFRDESQKGVRQFSVRPDDPAEEEDKPITFAEFDDRPHGSPIPNIGPDGTRNEPIRQLVLNRINGIEEYRRRFGEIFPQVASGAPVTFAMVGQALAEFQISLTFADAPIDHFARGEVNAMTDGQKRGALLFFGKANCVQCHAVSGQSNEMFSDFQMHSIGIPQIAPVFGKGSGNVGFRNAEGKFTRKGNQDFGLEDITGTDDNPRPGDRYKFRTSPLRNVAVHPSFFHNGAFTRLEDAIRHHLDVAASARNYDPAKAGVDEDLRKNVGPIDPVLQQLDPLLKTPITLSDQEFKDLLEFVRDGLLDPGAKPENLRRFIPSRVPSGKDLPRFEFP